ncbi:MAG: ABC transporter permease [Lachnospiraceae bacterium]|nr:ABC transporter permease [Candidatus Colinaster equi]
MNLLIENFRLALFSLKANKMRALLTMLGIIIGISSVIAIMTVGNSLSSDLNQSMSNIGAKDMDIMVTNKPQYDENGEEIYEYDNIRKIRPSDNITADMIEDYCQMYEQDIIAVSVNESVGAGSMKESGKSAVVNVIGGNYGYLYSARKELLQGRYFTDKEMSNGAMVGMVSDIVVENMFDGNMQTAIGSSVSVDCNGKEYSFTIVGVYKYEADLYSFGSPQSRAKTQSNLYIPIRTAKSLNHSDSSYSEATVILDAQADVEKMIENTKEFFNSNYYERNDAFMVDAYSMSSLLDQLSSMLDAVTLAISVIAGIALLVGGIGVMNIMMVSITERTREIGTRKALGATNASIRLQFIIEAIVICVIGGIIGMIFGILMGAVAAKLIESKPVISGSSIILSITFSTAIGIFFGYYPANKAAKMDPIEALRYE